MLWIDISTIDALKILKIRGLDLLLRPWRCVPAQRRTPISTSQPCACIVDNAPRILGKNLRMVISRRRACRGVPAIYRDVKALPVMDKWGVLMARDENGASRPFYTFFVPSG